MLTFISEKNNLSIPDGGERTISHTRSCFQRCLLPVWTVHQDEAGGGGDLSPPKDPLPSQPVGGALPAINNQPSVQVQGRKRLTEGWLVRSRRSHRRVLEALILQRQHQGSLPRGLNDQD